MCQYSSVDGMPSPWHHTHLVSRAVGGVGLVLIEATAVVPEGRISPSDMGIWSDAQGAAIAELAAAITAYGSVPGIQLAHAGRKASQSAPWVGSSVVPPSEGGWIPVGPSAIAFDKTMPTPRELESHEITALTTDFVAAARRAAAAGMRWIEIHAAHGYLLHSFHSPLSNHRTDEFGGSFDNRIRLTQSICRAVRAEVGEDIVLSVRLSCTDWADGGWTIEDSVRLSQSLRSCGIDLIDCSSGGLVPRVTIPLAPGYQVPFSRQIRAESALPTMAVGLITDPEQANSIVAEQQADVVLLGRELLRDPYWTYRAARKLGVSLPYVPNQYLRML
jgi:2,4-dienoyl-CoA reductase-like NADH-dependent reductase (Old Yellow Enzyme family)